MEKIIIIENIEWSVECWLENETLKTWFKSPVALPIHTSSDKSLIQDFEENGFNSDRFIKFFTTTLQSIIKQKYNAKIKDSFNTFYTQRGFQEILNILNDTTITDKIVALKEIQFDVTKRITKDEITLYVNEYKQYKDKIGGVDRSEIDELMGLLLLPLKSTQKTKRHLDYQTFKTLHTSTLAQYKYLNILSLDEFKKMFLSDECAYCGVSLQQIQSLRTHNKIASKSGRGFSLEIDRKEPNLEYTKENCCMSCYWCNNAKTDEFVPSEFKEIAKGINRVWTQRLNDTNVQEKVLVNFSEDSSIWEK